VTLAAPIVPQIGIPFVLTTSACPVEPEVAVIAAGMRFVCAWRLKLIPAVEGEMSAIGFRTILLNSPLRSAAVSTSPGIQTLTLASAMARPSSDNEASRIEP
jgi:hypothetical protein